MSGPDDESTTSAAADNQSASAAPAGSSQRSGEPSPASSWSFARWIPWVARVAWLVVAVIGGAAIEAAVDGRGDEIRWVAAVGGWTAWAIVTVGLLIASARSLTIVRVGVPVTGVVAVAAAIGGAGAVELIALVVPSIVAVAAVFTAEFGRSFVQASAYGDEQRFPLRPPAAVAVAAVISWAVWSAALVAGPLLLAARAWAGGALLSVAALAGLVLLGPRWHRLSRRWLVYVPAGIVVHDPVVLADTIALRTAQIIGIRLAPSNTEAADLTGPASGYALEIETGAPVTTVFSPTPSEPNGRAIHMTAFLVCPSRPGSALATAAERGLPVG